MANFVLVADDLNFTPSRFRYTRQHSGRDRTVVLMGANAKMRKSHHIAFQYYSIIPFYVDKPLQTLIER